MKSSWCAVSACAIGAAAALAPAPPVEVFDGVFSAADARALHDDCVALAGDVGTLPPWRDGSVTFARGAPRLRLEAALDSFLDEVGDDAPVVEWWWRQQWRPVGAHVDVDEEAAKEDPAAPLRTPLHAHVLSLAVGEDVRGPTCVWAAARRATH